MSFQSNAEKPVRSMTGYAQTSRHTPHGELTFSLRSVNHRGLDLHFHQSAEFLPYESAMRALLKERIVRGHVEIRAAIVRETRIGTSGYNRAVLKHYAEMFRQASRDLELSAEPDLNVLLGLPGVLDNSAELSPFTEAFETDFLLAFTDCINALNECREREGRELVACLKADLAGIEHATAHIQSLRADAVLYFQNRLREKLAGLLATPNISETRLAEEAALLAEKSDVQEELMRLLVHTRELRRILGQGGPVGKPLDFLLQELNRETNTTLSKSSGAGEPGLKIANLALSVKANIERIREQALNLE